MRTLWGVLAGLAMVGVLVASPAFGSALSGGGGSGGVSSIATATEAEASATEGEDTTLSVDLRKALRTTIIDLLSCEDQANDLCMVSGGKTRQLQILGTGGVPSTATDDTSAVSILPVGKKTFVGVVTCTGTCIQTQKIYGSWQNSTAYGEELCTLTMSDTTTAHTSCQVDSSWSFYFVVTTATSGTTPLSGTFAMY